MPKGVPKAGFRLRRNKDGEWGIPKSRQGLRADVNIESHINIAAVNVQSNVNNTVEPDDVVSSRIAKRFQLVRVMTQSAIRGEAPAIIISGPPGLGKSYTVEELLATNDKSGKNHTVVKGYVRATGLFKTLYKYRHEKNVVVFDDADSIFADETALNMLKAACDSNQTRKISYLSEYDILDDNGFSVPKTFEFKGSIIFITNYDFDALIDKGNKLAPHFSALMSRAHYIDLAIKHRRACFIRIKQVIDSGMLAHCSTEERQDVIDFIEENLAHLRELSLRTALKIATLRRADPCEWKGMSIITCCKQDR